MIRIWQKQSQPLSMRHSRLQLGWRGNAVKIAVLITDALPHGIEPPHGEPFEKYFDKNADGDPCGKDPPNRQRHG